MRVHAYTRAAPPLPPPPLRLLRPALTPQRPPPPAAAYSALTACSTILRYSGRSSWKVGVRPLSTSSAGVAPYSFAFSSLLGCVSVPRGGGGEENDGAQHGAGWGWGG